MAEQVDYSTVYEFLYRIDKRIAMLEKDAEFINTQITNLDGDVSGKFGALKVDLDNVHDSIKKLKSEFNNSVIKMVDMTKNLKLSAKKEDIEAAKNSVNELKFEEYITHEALKRGL